MKPWQQPLKYLRDGTLVRLGYLLSPLSWWNDVFFNLPIALVFGYGVSWVNRDWLLPGTLLGYWLSNVAGMVMMQMGAMDMVLSDGNIRGFRSALPTLRPILSQWPL